MVSGQILAILSAALFGVSPVFCKLVIGDMPPLLLAGLLYLGSGIGLYLVLLVRRTQPLLLAGLLYLGSGLGLYLVLLVRRTQPLRELRRLAPSHRLKLAGAVLSGGVVAPVFLVYGIKYGSASEVALLLNLETVATTLIAWIFFKEHVGVRVWGGKLLILGGACLVVLAAGEKLSWSLSGLLVALACVFWGLDNNLTRDVEELPATVLACVKGFSAGIFNTGLALAFTAAPATGQQLGGALAIGVLSYGVSLVLFVEALRTIGSARTSTLFAIGPFIGTLLAVAVLGERLPAASWFAAALMLGGIFYLSREMHAHLHTHEELVHSHSHRHDEHHAHPHDGPDAGEPHTHPHVHEPLTHIHGHWPDSHHRHGH